MDSMYALARQALDELPPVTRFTQGDADAIARHRDVLLSWETVVVQGFYDTLYAHGPTAAVFTLDERPEREATLSHWWRRTVGEPLDEDYFAWMAMVGLVHVVRGVSNPMMLAMTDFVVGTVAAAAPASGLAPEETDRLTTAFRRLTSTAGAIITCGYDQAVASALFSIAGMPDALLRRLRDQEVKESLVTARREVARGAGTTGPAPAG